jgi:hypothetical protein
MSYIDQKKHGGLHVYFVAGREGRYYLHPKGHPENINVQNVLKALKYVKEKHTRFSGLEYELVMKLPQPQRDEYLMERLLELYERPDKLIDSLSEAKQIEVLGLRMEELQTRLRQIEEFPSALNQKPYQE